MSKIRIIPSVDLGRSKRIAATRIVTVSAITIIAITITIITATATISGIASDNTTTVGL
jgi:hypothetical protein